MKAVVTGGTGFIGSHLVRGLVNMERHVVVASDFARLGTENLDSLRVRHDEIELRRADLRYYGQALEAIKGAKVVYHLAARIGSVEYLHNNDLSELAALQENLIIDANVFKACLESQVDTLIYTSSCAVYALVTQSLPGATFSEDEVQFRTSGFLRMGTAESWHPTIVDPDGGYGWAKLIGELQLSWMKGVRVGIARIFNAYGQNEPLVERAHVVGDLCRKVAQYPRCEFNVWGDGTQTRDLLHVRDCADALLKLEAVISGSNDTWVKPTVVNVGSGEAVSVNSLAQEIIAISGKHVPVLHDVDKPVGPVSRTANMDHTKALLGWQPKTSLRQGLEQTYKWVERKMGEQSSS